MQVAALPTSICDEVDKRCRSFVWGMKRTSVTIISLIGTQFVTPKKLGGLNLRATRLVNETFLFKNNWNLCTNHSSLWVAVMRNKYRCDNSILPNVNVQR